MIFSLYAVTFSHDVIGTAAFHGRNLNVIPMYHYNALKFKGLTKQLLYASQEQKLFKFCFAASTSTCTDVCTCTCIMARSDDIKTERVNEVLP